MWAPPHPRNIDPVERASVARHPSPRDPTDAAQLEALAGALAAAGVSRVARDAPLAPLTTFGVGGPADLLVEARTSREALDTLRLAHAHGIPVTLLGGGSNVLVADAGVRGVVLRVHGGDVAREGEDTIRADAGVTVNGLVRWTIARGLASVEAWAGTPGTVGGAIFGNAHFQGANIGDLVESVRLATAAGDVSDVPAAAMEFGYDASRLQRTREVLLSALFRVRPGDPASLREIARASLAYRKRTQPLDKRSAGCIFQNPDPARDPVPAGVPCSAGALVDRAGLKGHAIGGARVSPVHANFIVSDGHATAAEIRQLIERCRAAVAERFDVALRDEIVCLGEF